MRAHPGAHLAGPDNHAPAAAGLQRLTEPEVETVQAGLGGAVDEVGSPDPLTGGRAHCDDLAENLRPDLLTHQHAHGNRCGVVDFGDLDRLTLVLPQLLGVTEQPERHDRDVYISTVP